MYPVLPKRCDQLDGLKRIRCIIPILFLVLQFWSMMCWAGENFCIPSLSTRQGPPEPEWLILSATDCLFSGTEVVRNSTGVILQNLLSADVLPESVWTIADPAAWGAVLIGDATAMIHSASTGLPLPATLTLIWSGTVRLERLRMEALSREKGFSEVLFSAQRIDENQTFPPLIRSASACSGKTPQDGFQWEYCFEPVEIQRLNILFRMGTLADPGQVWLKRIEVRGE
jgi:hypothetical protein